MNLRVGESCLGFGFLRLGSGFFASRVEILGSIVCWARETDVLADFRVDIKSVFAMWVPFRVSFFLFLFLIIILVSLWFLH